MISVIFKFLVNSYLFIEWPTGQEILLALIAGGFTSIVAIWIYLWQKHREQKENTYNAAETIYTEISRMMKVARVKNNYVHEYGIPTTKVYHGLLSSGNIKYFTNTLQNDLDRFYMRWESSFKNKTDAQSSFLTENSLESGKRLVKLLEEIMHKNRSFKKIYYEKFG